MSAVDLAQALWLLVAALGLALSVSYAGLPVLGQGAFVAVGGFGTALLGPGGEGWPLGLACAASVLLAAVLGWLVALGASRLEGAYLALATWALAWLVHRALLAYPDVTGGADGLTRPAPAHLVSPALGVEWVLTPAVHVVLAAAVCVVIMAALVRVDRGPGGLDLAALREGPALAASLGVPVAARRRTVLSVTAALGAVSGAGTTVLLGLIAPSDVSPLLSLQLFVAVLLGGVARWWGPVLGVAVLTAIPPLADAAARAGGLDAERSRGVITAALLVAVLALR
ncbi:MAG: branched-chain amino acid ABC transporter permease, partial [Mycobacteriales bacterium]